MMHFNLIRRTAGVLFPVYYIRTNISGTFWYFFDFTKNENTIVWTARISKAMQFTTEKEVEDFKANFFQDRDCEIIRI